MAGNVVRIGDKITCGDFVAVGSSNVFAGGMPIAHQGKKTTTGHGCYPPSEIISKFSSTVFVNNQPVSLKGGKIRKHRCGKHSHDGEVVTSAATVSVEQ